MPELPEVETSRAYVEEFCLGATITKCHATEQGGGPRDGKFDELVIGEDVTAERLTTAIEGRTIVALKRRGKQMWFVLDRPPHILFHFGMTGAFTVKGEKRHKFVKFKVAEEWPPRFAKLELQMSNGACLALTDPRRLARVRLRTEPETSPPISLLGPDPITHPITLDAFAGALAKPTAPIKAVLLAQDRVVSGVGNWVADEVCFQAEVHPGAVCNTLSPEQVSALHTKLLSVCREACEARADYMHFPEHWLFHHRWGKGKNAEGAPRVSSGHPIVFDVVGGRTTAIVPAVQRKGQLSADTKAGKPKTTIGAKRAKKRKDVVKKEEDEEAAEEDSRALEEADVEPGAGSGKGKLKAAKSPSISSKVKSEEKSDPDEKGKTPPNGKGKAGSKAASKATKVAAPKAAAKKATKVVAKAAPKKVTPKKAATEKARPKKASPKAPAAKASTASKAASKKTLTKGAKKTVTATAKKTVTKAATKAGAKTTTKPAPKTKSAAKPTTAAKAKVAPKKAARGKVKAEALPDATATDVVGDVVGKKRGRAQRGVKTAIANAGKGKRPKSDSVKAEC